jgi:hypothetical protein
MAAMGSSFNEDTGSFGYTPTAEITVAVSIACLFVMGLICSFPTLWLHKVFMWFAPINSKYPPSPQASLLVDANDSLGICRDVHCTLSPEAKQAFRRRCFR